MDDARHALECALLKALASLKVPLEVRQNVALLISLHANRGSGADPFGTTDTLMREPPKRQGAKRRQRCQDEAWKIFGRLMQQVKPGSVGLHPIIPCTAALTALGAMPLNAFGFWDGGDDDGCCLVPTCSFFNHSCEPNCLHRMEYGEVRLDSMLFVTLRQMKNSLFLIWIRNKLLRR